jgi:hypothetical protein
MSLLNLNITINHHHAPVTPRNGTPAPLPNPDSSNTDSHGRKKNGMKVTMVDVLAGGIFATIQSFWNTPMLAWMTSVLHHHGVPADLAVGIATFVIAIAVSALPVCFRWLMRKLYC